MNDYFIFVKEKRISIISAWDSNHALNKWLTEHDYDDLDHACFMYVCEREDIRVELV